LLSGSTNQTEIAGIYIYWLADRRYICRKFILQKWWFNTSYTKLTISCF